MPRPIKTLQEHLLHGSKPQNSLPGAVDIPAGRPRVPKGLSPEAKKLYRTLSKQLAARRHLTEADGEILRLYVLAADRERHAQEHINAEGEVCMYTRLDSNGQPHDVEKENLWLGVAERAHKEMMALLDRLGLSPAARQRVRPLKEIEPELDELEQMMARGPRIVPFARPENEEPENAE